MDAVTQQQTKIQQLFQKFLEPDFEIKNDTYLSRLLTHLSNQEKPVDATLADNLFFSEWLIQSVTTWENSTVTPSVNISSFTLNLASLVSRNENRFIALNSNNFYQRLIQVLRVRQADIAPSVKLGYVKLLGSFLEHKAGIQWIVGCDLWMDVLKITLSNQTVYITREGYRFMSKILEQTIDHDENFCHGVVKQIMLPLGENTYKTIKATGEMMEISDEIVYKNLTPTLQLVGDILEHFLESVLFAQNDSRIVLIFLKDFHLEQQICNFMMIAQNKHLFFDLGKIIFIMQFLEMYIGVICQNLKMSGVTTSVRKIMSIFTTNISRGNFENVMKLCYYGQFYWNLMGYKVPCIKVNKDNEPISFANQLLVIQLLPVFALAMKYTVGETEALIADEFRDEYVQKLFMMMCENTVRIAYSWRDFLVAQPNLFEMATKGLSYVMKSRKYYPRERAAMAFQSFVYCLKDIMRAIKQAPERLPIFCQQIPFISMLFDAFVVFIEEFQITWRDSVETICVMSISFDFLSVPTWPTQLVVKALKLVNVSLVKYMSPNLALLVDRTNDSTLAVLGPLLHTKLHDMAWEVRDSALEVVCTISHMSTTIDKMEHVVCTKIKTVLRKLQKNDDRRNLDRFLHLCSQPATDLISLPTFAEWIKEAVFEWSATGVSPGADVSAFTLNLASLLSKDEDRFCDLNNKNFFIKLVNVTKARLGDVGDEIKLGYIGLLSSFLEHTSGIEWTIACNFWENIFQLNLSNQNDLIIGESTKFMSKMLEKTVDSDEGFCDNVVKRIMLPLGENIYKSMKASNESMDVSQEVASQYLKPTLRLIGNVLEYFLEGVHFGRKDFQVLAIFLKNFHLEERISDFMIIAQSKCLVFELGKIMFIMQFLELYAKIAANSISAANVDATVRRIHDNYLLNVSRGNFEDVIEFCDFGQLFWNLVESKIPRLKTKEDNKLCLCNQLAFLQLLPHYTVLLKYYWGKEELEDLLKDDLRDTYIHKIMKLMCHETVRACYAWRDQLVLRDDLFKICILINCRIKESRKYLSKDRALIIAQTYIYMLQDIVTCGKEHPSKLHPFLKEVEYFSQVLELLVVLIEEFHLTWTDSLEALNLLSIAFDFLMIHRWPSAIVARILKLINVATAKYMAPNLALLLDSTSDSTVVLLGPILYGKLCDEVPEVKCAGLEVVCTVARMSSSIRDKMKPAPNRHLSKVKLLLRKLIGGQCDNASLQRFLTLLRQQEATGIESTLILLPIFTEWIKSAVARWRAAGISPATNTISFIFNLASLLAREERRFRELNTGDFFGELLKTPRTELAVKLGYVRLSSSLLEHKSGVELIVSCNFWEEIFEFSVSENCGDLGRESVLFMAKLLEESVHFDEDFCREVVKKVTMPLRDSIYRCLKAADDVNDLGEASSQYLGNTFRLVGEIIDYFSEGILLERKDFRVLQIFHENFDLEEQISDILTIAKSGRFVFEFGKVMFMMEFLNLYFKSVSKGLSPLQINASVDRIRSNFILSISRGDFEVALEFCNFAQVFWSLMDRKIPRIEVDGKSSPISDQLIILLLFPNNLLLVNHCLPQEEILDLLHEDSRDGFFYKMTKIMCPDVFRACRNWRDKLLERRLALYDLAGRSLDRIRRSRRYISRPTAIVIFQSLIYSSKDFVHAAKKSEKKLLIIERDLHYFSKVLEVLGMLIEEFKITWRDSVEAVDVMVVSFDFLSLPRWSKDVVLQALNLVNIAIAKYMSPNMALLVDSTEDCIIDLMGPLLYVKLYDEEGEVKKAALEVICTMAEMSRCHLESTLVLLPTLTEWLKSAVAEWSTTRATPDTHTIVFTLDLASLLARKEERFNALDDARFLKKLLKISKARSEEGVKLSYLGLLSAFLEHTSGIKLVVASNCWKDLCRLSLSEDKDVGKKAALLLAKLLEKTVSLEENFCSMVVKRIMRPLVASDNRSLTDNVEETFFKCVGHTLKVIGDILDYFFEGIVLEKKDFQVVLLFFENFHLTDEIAVTEFKDFVFDFGKILFFMQFLDVYVAAATGSSNPSEVGASVDRIRSNFILSIARGKYEDSLDFCNFSQLYWRLINDKIPQNRTQTPRKLYPLQDQLLGLLLFPNTMLLLNHFLDLDQIRELVREEFRSGFYEKVGEMLSPEVYRACVHWREHIFAHAPNLYDLSSKSLEQIKRSKVYFSRDAAVVTFQSLIYSSKDLIHAVRASRQKRQAIGNDVAYFGKALEVLGILIEEFRLTWRDSFEVMDVMVVAFDFLSMPGGSPEIAVQALKLIDIAIGKYMSPNMTLLVDSTEDSIVGSLGPLLYAKSIGEGAEEKKAALDVIRTMARMSRDRKFLKH